MAKRRLSRSLILSTALTLLEAQGRRGLSMRALGRALGCEAMALYRYFPSLGALETAVALELLESLEPPDPQLPWPQGVAALCWSIRRLACGQLHGAVLLLERFVEDPAGPVGLRLREGLEGLLVGAGVPPTRALEVSRGVLGVALSGALLEARVPLEAEGCSGGVVLHFVGVAQQLVAEALARAGSETLG